jgi:hypothetical protein
MSPLGGALRFAAWALLPLVLFIGLFLAAIGIEEEFGASVLSEPMGRATPFIVLALLALAMVTSVSFAVACWRTKPASDG